MSDAEAEEIKQEMTKLGEESLAKAKETKEDQEFMYFYSDDRVCSSWNHFYNLNLIPIHHLKMITALRSTRINCNHMRASTIVAKYFCEYKK